MTTSGQATPELHRRVGEAGACFNALAAVWKHANIPLRKKYRIFEACVVSKLLYGLESLWLLKAHQQKLDAFGARCLRRIAKVSPSYLSRVSNANVLRRFGADPLSTSLERRQLTLLWKIAQQPDGSLTRQMAFEPSSYKPRSWHPNRRVGRPCLRWVDCVYGMAVDVCHGNNAILEETLATPDPQCWGRMLRAAPL